MLGVKVSIKVLFRETLTSGKRLLREGVNYLDLSSVPEEIALLHSVYLSKA